MGIDEILMIVAFIILTLIFFSGRLSIIGLDKHNVMNKVSSLKKLYDYSSKPALHQSGTRVGLGANSILVVNPEPSKEYSTQVFGYGVTLDLVVISQYKYRVSLIGYRNGAKDIHSSVIEIPPSSYYYVETDYMNNVAITGTNWGVTRNADFQVDFVYRYYGDKILVFVRAQPIKVH